MKSLNQFERGFCSYTIGRYERVAIVEGDSIEAAMKALFIFGQSGTDRTKNMAVIAAEEAVNLAGERP